MAYTPVPKEKRKSNQGRKPKAMEKDLERACLEAIELYKDGYTLENAAAATGIKYTVIHRHRKKNIEIDIAFKEACQFRLESSKVALADQIQSSMVRMCGPREVKKVITKEIKQGDKVISIETETEIKTVEPHPQVLQYYSGVVGIIPAVAAAGNTGNQSVIIQMLHPSSSTETGEEKKEEENE